MRIKQIRERSRWAIRLPTRSRRLDNSITPTPRAARIDHVLCKWEKAALSSRVPDELGMRCERRRGGPRRARAVRHGFGGRPILPHQRSASVLSRLRATARRRSGPIYRHREMAGSRPVSRSALGTRHLALGVRAFEPTPVARPIPGGVRGWSRG